MEDFQASHKNSSRREENKKTNREQILKAALKVFGEKGFDASNVRDVIRESELSPGTFYNYFQSKEDVFKVLLDEIMMDIHSRSRETWLKAWKGVRTGTNVKDAFVEFFNIFQENPEYLYFFAKNQHYVRDQRYSGKMNEIVISLDHDIQEAVKEGNLPSFPTKIVTHSLFGTVFEVLAEMVLYPEKVSIPEVSENLANFFTGGVLALTIKSGTQEITENVLALANFPIEILSGLLGEKKGR
jgi:AcrR family transcriptional regulator